MQTLTTGLCYGCVFVSDVDGGDLPPSIWGRTINLSSSCVMVACLNEQDGDTKLSLGTPIEIEPIGIAIIDQKIELPTRTVVLSTAERSVLLRMRTFSTSPRLRIWRNHSRWADDVRVAVG